MLKWLRRRRERIAAEADEFMETYGNGPFYYSLIPDRQPPPCRTLMTEFADARLIELAYILA
jgi:hypothetical protein